MTTLKTTLSPADILCTRSASLPGELIRIGEELSGKVGMDNHVAVMHHWDGDVPWGLEGRPGGVGWRDLRPYIASPYTINNCLQPDRTPGQRMKVAARAQAMLATAYDWMSIADDALRAFGMADLWAKDWHGQAPGHVVCSSLAAYLYEAEGWARPEVAGRDTEPGDWAEFCLAGRYSASLR